MGKVMMSSKFFINEYIAQNQLPSTLIKIQNKK